MSSLVVELNDSGFEEQIKQDIPILIDFWAPWCGPCRALAPVLDKLATDYEDRLLVAKINVDENKNTPGKFGVRSIPNLVFLKNGELVEQVVGAKSEEELKKIIDKIIG